MKFIHYGVLLLLCLIVETYQQYQQYQTYQGYQQQPQSQQGIYQQYQQQPQYAQLQPAQDAYYQNISQSESLDSTPVEQHVSEESPSQNTESTYPPDVQNQTTTFDQPSVVNSSSSDENFYNQSMSDSFQDQSLPPRPSPSQGKGEPPPKDPKHNPLTYSLSFFLFDTKEMLGKLNHKNVSHNSTSHIRRNYTTFQSDLSRVPEANHSSALNYTEQNTNQTARIHHPKLSKTTHFPLCHHCKRNSTYEQCINVHTMKSCNKGLKNICYTKSHVRNGTVFYEMGCADHKQCHTADVTPCRGNKKKCFTCCHWDKCNSSPHYGEQITGFMVDHSNACTNNVCLVVVAVLVQVYFAFMV